MKRVITFLLAVLMVVSLFAFTASARGYVLSVPATVSAHNLEAYGLHTMNVYSTEVAPQINGEVSDGEYPGPNNGVSLTSKYGDNMFAGTYIASSSGYQEAYEPSYDYTPYISKEDFPEYMNTYLTYDDEYLYFAVSTVVPEIRVTTTTDKVETGADKGAYLRNGTWHVAARFNFSQSENISASHSNSVGYNQYDLVKLPEATAATKVTLGRNFTIKSASNKFTTTKYNPYVDSIGQQWSTTVYKREENFNYKVTILPDNKWGLVFEGRLLLADILRLTDVEYENGAPIDYVPEWGAWGFNMRLQTNQGSKHTLPNGSELTILPDENFMVQTFRPCVGLGRSAAGAIIGDYTFTNTISAAITSTHGKATTYLMNPVHFLGKYDGEFNYDGVYSEPAGTFAKTTTRATRNRASVLTSGVRGVNNRVVGVATQAAGATGDSLTMTIVLSVTMLLLAVVAVAVVLMKKRSARY